jgi:hypothetical protein
MYELCKSFRRRRTRGEHEDAYWPDEEIVDGSWQPPGIERVN